jgi:hypothetical protein
LTSRYTFFNLPLNIEQGGLLATERALFPDNSQQVSF